MMWPKRRCLFWNAQKFCYKIIQQLNPISSSLQECRTLLRTQSGRDDCNIDASFSRHLNKVGIGICLRDDIGTFVLAKTDWFSSICDVHIGEALGLLSALKWVHELHLGPIDFELDAKKVVDNFLSSTNDGAEFGDIIQSCQSIFRNLYENCGICVETSK